jgi:hypothetical protein
MARQIPLVNANGKCRRPFASVRPLPCASIVVVVVVSLCPSVLAYVGIHLVPLRCGPLSVAHCARPTFWRTALDDARSGAARHLRPPVPGAFPIRQGPRLRMAAGSGDENKLAEAEAALDDAIADNDVNAINKWMKVLEKLQVVAGGAAGAAPYSQKKMSKEEEAEAIQELLGRLNDNAADDVADALTATALEDMAVALQAAESALDDAIASSDAAAIASATRRLEELQGSAAGDAAIDFATLPGSDVERDLAAALESAALEEGADADDLGLLDDLALADLDTRVEAARSIVEEAVAANDVQALANSISVLTRLLGTAATSEALTLDDNMGAVEKALRNVGIDNLASAEAAAEIAGGQCICNV